MLVSYQLVPSTAVPEIRFNQRVATKNAVQGFQIDKRIASAAFCAACVFASSKNREHRSALRQSAKANVGSQDLFETLKAQQEKVRQRVAEKKARREKENDLPAPWRMVSHPSEPGKVYYYNEETGETSWEAPGSSPWRQVEDPSNPGRFYYYNQATGETTWEVPAEFEESNVGAVATTDTVEELPKDATTSETSSVADVTEELEEPSPPRSGAATRLMAGESILAEEVEQLSAPELEVAQQPIDENALKKDSEDSQERLKILAEEAARRREVMKVRREVMKGLREKTSGGLTKDDLMVNKHGKIVSKKRHERGLKLFTRHLAGWIEAVKSARSKLSVLGFRPIGGRTKEGKELYSEAKQIYTESRTNSDS